MDKLSSVPTELKQRKQWVLWKLIERHGKPTKIPFQPSGEPASSTGRETWSSFKSVVESMDGYAGAGFVFDANDCYIGIDLDGCINPETKVVEQWAREVVIQMQSYAEISPSGTGIKIFASSAVRWPHRKKIELPYPAVCDKQPAIEVYDHGRYFAVTGKRLKDMIDVMPIDEYFDWLADKFGMRNTVAVIDGTGIKLETPIAERAAKYLSKLDPSIAGQSGHNRCFQAACVLVMGFGMTESEALTLLKQEFNPRCDPPWSEKELIHKVKCAVAQPGSRGYLRDANPLEWSKIRMPSTYREPVAVAKEESDIAGLRITTMRDATAAYMSMLASGKEALVDTGIPEIDYAIGGGIAMGEMVVVAARPSHGKSAVALQMAHSMSLDGLPVAIVSEEMSALALGKRAIQFLTDTPEEHWKTNSDTVNADIERHFKKRAEVTIIESCGSVERACSEIEKLVVSGGVKVAVIDYAQLLQAKGNGRYEQITKVSQTLRMLASRLQIIVIVLAQLNREIEKRNNFIPKSSDIKETGQLEQDADVIIFGVWPHRIDSSKPAKEYQFYISKNRNRAINKGLVECEFQPARQKLVEQKIDLVEMEDFSHWANR
jgi:KaiC/GvpD/RAD55 family RecA-like ATPase